MKGSPLFLSEASASGMKEPSLPISTVAKESSSEEAGAIYSLRTDPPANSSPVKRAVRDTAEEPSKPSLLSSARIAMDSLPVGMSMRRNPSFRYEGPGSPWVLRKLDLYIPAGKVTAVVGESGSGKTTLLKMLLGFYRPEEGDIYIGGTRLEEIRISSLRKNTGVVMQDGYILPDTIRGNIAPGE